MIHSYWLSGLFLIGTITLSQAQINLQTWKTESKENITVERLDGDTLTTSFIIEVKDSVPSHYHAFHSEHIYVLSGKGLMKLNAETIEISEGHYHFIPSGSVHAVRVMGNNPLRVLSIQCPEFNGKDRVKAL